MIHLRAGIYHRHENAQTGSPVFVRSEYAYISGIFPHFADEKGRETKDKIPVFVRFGGWLKEAFLEQCGTCPAQAVRNLRCPKELRRCF